MHTVLLLLHLGPHLIIVPPSLVVLVAKPSLHLLLASQPGNSTDHPQEGEEGRSQRHHAFAEENHRGAPVAKQPAPSRHAPPACSFPPRFSVQALSASVQHPVLIRGCLLCHIAVEWGGAIATNKSLQAKQNIHCEPVVATLFKCV